EEPVVGQGGQVEFEGRRRTAARRLQADPPEPVARRRGLVWEEPEPVERLERGARWWFRLSYHLTPLLSPGVLIYPSSIVPTRDHPNGRRLRASRSPSRGGNKRTQTRSNPVTSRFRNHWRGLGYESVGATGFEPSQHRSLPAPNSTALLRAPVQHTSARIAI